MSRITLGQANAIIAGAFAKGRELGLKPLCVAVLDCGSHVVAMQRQDGASTLVLRSPSARPPAHWALVFHRAKWPRWRQIDQPSLPRWRR
jgi:uncharacterized protein GlcG (DUF336 family)